MSESKEKKESRGRPTVGPNGRRGVATYCMLEPRHRKALAVLADRDARNLSNYLRRVITQHIEGAALVDPELTEILGGEVSTNAKPPI